VADIFISYKREEQDKARQLAVALEKQGWSVWWDPKLRAGDYFDDVIEKALNEARCVIVMWSKRSVPPNITMSNYLRVYVPGGCFFFTLVTHGRQRLFEEDENVDRLREGLRSTMKKHPFQIDAIVILPDHLHTVWWLPPGDTDYPLRWRLIKHYLASGILAPTNHRGEKRVWQRRFWEHVIRNEDDWRNHVDYVHYNPVKHRYVKRPSDWRWSSFERASRRGWYSSGWGALEPMNLCGMNFE